MLTLQKLKDMPPSTVFASGLTTNSPEGIYMTDYREGDNLFWVAKRGGIYDWAIYIGWAEWGLKRIEENGDKVRDSRNVKKLVPCDNEALDMYRF